MTTKEFLDKVMNWEDRSPTMVLEATVMVATEIITALAGVQDRIEIEGKMARHTDSMWLPELKLYTDMKEFVTRAINAFDITFDTDQYPEGIEGKDLIRIIDLITLVSEDINSLTKMINDKHSNIISELLNNVLDELELITDDDGNAVDIFWIDELTALYEAFEAVETNAN